MNGNIVIRHQEEFRAFALDKSTTRIGSGSDAGLVILAPGIEPVHAVLAWEPRASTWLLSAASPVAARTLSLNGQPCSADAALEDGDLIELPGGVAVKFAAAPSLPRFNDKETREIPLRGISKLIIGRASGDAWGDSGKVQLDPEDARISRNHLELEQPTPGVIFATDKSTTGTLLNGQRFDRRQLVAGDRLRLGGYNFAFTGDALQLAAGHGGTEVEARNLSLPSRDGRHILNDVSLDIAPCSFVGITSGSGQEKNALLHALCGANPASDGEVYINGTLLADPRAMAGAGIGYVPKDDIVHRELTVTEAITYSARLKLPANTPRTAMANLVEETIERLGLSDDKNKRIHQLAGCQRKGVSIAVELLARPRILFLDEPTSGLDANSELELMSLLRRLTSADCTVVCATHAPACAYLFDQLCCLHDGRLIFNGTPDEAIAWFGINNGLDEIDSKISTAKADAVAGTKAPVFLPPADEGNPAGHPRMQRKGYLRQLGILLQRQWSIFKARPRNLIFLLVQPLIIGLLIGWVLNQTPQRMFLCVAAVFCFGCSNSMRQIARETAVLRSERASGLGLNSYLQSKYIFLAFVTTLQAMLLIFIIKAPSAMKNSPTMFGADTGLWPAVLFGSALAGVSTGLTISATLRTGTLAFIWKLLDLIPLFIFVGFAFSFPEMLASASAPVSLAVLGGWIAACYGSTLLALKFNLRGKTPLTCR